MFNKYNYKNKHIKEFFNESQKSDVKSALV